MTAYTVAAGEIGAYEKTLTAATVDTVTFADPVDVEVVSDGSSPLYFTVNGVAPTVGGAGCWHIPAVVGVRTVDGAMGAGTVVKLISAGTPVYSVSRTD